MLLWNVVVAARICHCVVIVQRNTTTAWNENRLRVSLRTMTYSTAFNLSRSSKDLKPGVMFCVAVVAELMSLTSVY